MKNVLSCLHIKTKLNVTLAKSINVSYSVYRKIIRVFVLSNRSNVKIHSVFETSVIFNVFKIMYVKVTYDGGEKIAKLKIYPPLSAY